ncbi:hypothetical protein BDA96_03G018800 [Sorghum bicolor]|uniref:Uncharacterized protein n=2 Tax=Sorghum bicolor TaxID=4558 RepID=A0A921R8N3_SORBI|nr:uncharacterized protein LOC110433593 [Sorghum bicolor]KAG0535913.1 hypothetical protein BDA96_03G018800 [Sorghum bicolor]OQU86101.1 hypothetical protein SORBI_3003G016950 [Sorghum bicolor]|eukprot:XP_021311731.1 uncharacterized protein LOC110433593 [Sorghum bicolor]
MDHRPSWRRTFSLSLQLKRLTSHRQPHALIAPPRANARANRPPSRDPSPSPHTQPSWPPAKLPRRIPSPTPHPLSLSSISLLRPATDVAPPAVGALGQLPPMDDNDLATPTHGTSTGSTTEMPSGSRHRAAKRWRRRPWSSTSTTAGRRLPRSTARGKVPVGSLAPAPAVPRSIASSLEIGVPDCRGPNTSQAINAYRRTPGGRVRRGPQ